MKKNQVFKLTQNLLDVDLPCIMRNFLFQNYKQELIESELTENDVDSDNGELYDIVRQATEDWMGVEDGYFQK